MLLPALIVIWAQSPDSGSSPLDSAAVIARARSLHPFISAGDPGPLWTRFDDVMRVPAAFVDLVVDGKDVERAEILRGQTVRRQGTK